MSNRGEPTRASDSTLAQKPLGLFERFQPCAWPDFHFKRCRGAWELGTWWDRQEAQLGENHHSLRLRSWQPKLSRQEGNGKNGAGIHVIKEVRDCHCTQFSNFSVIKSIISTILRVNTLTSDREVWSSAQCHPLGNTNPGLSPLMTCICRMMLLYSYSRQIQRITCQ